MGGTSEIIGRLLVRNYDSNYRNLISTYYGQDEDVFIVYGNDSIYADRFRTDENGYYRFQYLRKGKYTLYAYSEDSLMLSPSGKKAVKVEVEITEGHQTVQAKTIVILK